jgi:hypothetical protein
MATYEQVAKLTVATAMEGVRVRQKIAYTQGGTRWSGIDRHIKGPSQPPAADCSSYTTWLAWQSRIRLRKGAGTDVINGLRWQRGNTATQITKGKRHRLGVNGWIPGRTLVFYGHPVHHVALYVGHGRVVSHGSNPGPLYLPWNYRGDFNHARAYKI